MKNIELEIKDFVAYTYNENIEIIVYGNGCGKNWKIWANMFWDSIILEIRDWIIEKEL